MAAIELMQGYVSLSVSAKGVTGDLDKAFEAVKKDAKLAGDSAGRSLADGIGFGVDKAAADLARASRVLDVTARAAVVARDKQEGAARKLAIAEAKLAELTESGKAKQSQLLAAQDRVTAARKASSKAALDVAAAEQKERDASAAATKATLAQSRALHDLAADAGQAERATGGFLSKLRESAKAKVGNPFKVIEADARRLNLGALGRKQGEDYARGVEGATKGIKLPSMLAGAAGGLVAGAGSELVSRLTSGLSGAIEKASDYNETISKAQAIFGAQMPIMDKWGDTAARTMGMSKSAALESAASFGDMFRQLGYTGDAAAKSARDVNQMAADLGSFNNLDTSDVLDKISGAMRGEYDSLQAIIPNISAARVEQEAMTLAGTKNVKSLTAQQKSEAVMAIIRKDGARAMGDYAKTADGVANGQKTLNARMEDFQGRMGQAMIPAKQFALDVGMKMLNLMDRLGPSVSSASAFFERHRAVLGVVGVAVGAMGVAYGGYRLAMATANGVQLVLNATMRANPIGLVTLALVGLAAGLVYAYKHSETFRRIVNGAFQSVTSSGRAMWSWLNANAFQPMGRFFTQTIPNATHTGLTGFRNAMQGMQDKGQAVWSWLNANAFQPMHTFFATTIPGALSSFGKKFSDVWDGLKSAAAKPINFVIKAVWNDGLRAVLNKIPGVSVGEVAPIKMARGGSVSRGDAASSKRPILWGEVPGVEEYYIPINGSSRSRGLLAEAGQKLGMWPVGAAGEALGGGQNARSQSQAIPAHIAGMPTNLMSVIRRGPRDGDEGFGGPAENGLAMLGQSGWYRRCLAFVNAAWGHAVSRFGMATARQSMNAGPRHMEGEPPRGSAVYWDTGGWAGHIALGLGDGTELSNDIGSPGMISRVPHDAFRSRWGAKYMGWWHPSIGNAAGGMIAGADPGSTAPAITPEDVSSGVDGVLAKINSMGSQFGPWGSLLMKPMSDFANRARDWGIHTKLGGANVDISLPGNASEIHNQVAASVSKYHNGWLNNHDQWNALSSIINNESSWNPNSKNSTSTARGLFQLLYEPGTSTPYGVHDVDTQVRDGLSNIGSGSRNFHDPVGAWDFWQKNHWYDQGGYLQPGRTAVMNGTGSPEPVFTAAQWHSIDALAGAGAVALSQGVGSSGALQPAGRVVNFNGPIGYDPQAIVDLLEHEDRKDRIFAGIGY